ncbi:CapA family protein [Virgibacillus ainsalahensis]
MRRNIFVWLFILLFFSLFLSACSAENDTVEMDVHESKKVGLQSKEALDYTQKITFAAIGDMLIHERVYQDARIENGYDFTPMLEAVEPFLSNPTITFANQETMIGGEKLGLSSYPSFNSPHEVGDALKNVGVNVVSLANNHTLDRGEEAIQQAIQHWEKIDMMYTGAYKNQVDQENIRVFETKEEISVAFLAYTYGTNGIPVPEGKDYLVNLINKEQLAEEVAMAKEQADVVALSLHFGNEYERMPNEQQKDLVQFAADKGVHVIIGHHPHVLQPVEWVTGENGNETLVIYSLGNFLSGQDEFYRRIGGILNFTITKNNKTDKQSIEIEEPRFIPTFVKFSEETDYEVVPMYQLTEDELSDAEEHYQEIKAHMSQWMPELEFVEE